MEQDKHQKNSKTLKIVIVVVLAALLAYAVESRINPSLPKPATINEPLKTYYLGNMALEMPESWKMADASTTFFQVGEKDDSRRGYALIRKIKFTDKPWSGDQDAAEKLKAELAALKKIQRGIKDGDLSGQEDLSEIFGRPAAIDILDTQAYLSKSDYSTYWQPLNNDRNEMSGSFIQQTDRIWSGRDCIELTLFLVEPQAVYTFEYGEDLAQLTGEEKAELIAAKRKMLIDWVLAFLPRYQWTGGKVAPADGFLATEYGHIAVGKHWPESGYALTARFSRSHLAGARYNYWLEDHFHITFSSIQRVKNQDTRPNRTVGGYAGKETKKLGVSVISNKVIERLKFWEPLHLYLGLEWGNLSNEQATKANPGLFIRGNTSSHQRRKQDMAYVLGVWDIMLNSLRPIPGLD